MDPIVTERLLLRPMVPSDAEAVSTYRSDPAVVEYQDWKLPYPVERAADSISRYTEVGGVVAGKGYNVGVERRDTGELIGDVYIGRHETFPTAEVGYTFASAHQGHGYATEALDAVIAHLFDDVGLVRLEASLDPRNIASEMLLERVGFVHEGTRTESFFNDPEWSDDGLYGMRRVDWEAWRGRNRSRPASVELVEVNRDNFGAVTSLTTHHSQRRFVGPVLNSMADALVPPIENGVPVTPWFRAIEADGVVAGFVMLACRTPDFPVTVLWRLIIDRMHQRRGIGTMVLDELCTTLRAQGESALQVSYVPGRGSPAPLYLGYGFVPTGVVDDGEIVAELRL